MWHINKCRPWVSNGSQIIAWIGLLNGGSWYITVFPCRFSHWGSFIQRLRVLAANSTALRNSKHISPDALLQLTSDTRRVLSRECKTIFEKQFHAVVTSGSLISSAGQCHGISWSALWLPIDMFLEDSMDGSQVVATSAVETLTGTLFIF